MRRAILIGFQYSGTQKLPGIVTDLFQMYTFLKTQGWNDSEIKVLTDIEKDETAQRIRKAVVEKLVDATILSFIEDLKTRQQYVKFTSHKHYNNFSSIFPSDKDYLFVYYTGHAKNQHLLLPESSSYSFQHFQKLFGQQTSFCVMDCCDGGLELPFNLISGVYRSNSVLELTKSKIICISSTKRYHKSITGETGSPFTQNLISVLSNYEFIENRSLIRLSQKVSDKILKNFTISSSYPNLTCIFGFVYSKATLQVNIYPNFIKVSGE